MALSHAQPGEIIDLSLLEEEAESGKQTRALFKADGVEVLRIALGAGEQLREHQTPGAVIVHCLEGAVGFEALGKTQKLSAGQLLHLSPKEPHAVRSIEDAVLLVTIVLAP